jgi:hypothetical protein
LERSKVSARSETVSETVKKSNATIDGQNILNV